MDELQSSWLGLPPKVSQYRPLRLRTRLKRNIDVETVMTVRVDDGTRDWVELAGLMGI